MLYFIYHDINIILKSHFCRKNVIILSLCTQRCYWRHKISENLKTTSGLSILLHGVISLPDERLYDKQEFDSSRNILVKIVIVPRIDT